VLLDNDRGLVARHDRLTREVEFNTRLHAAKHWGFRSCACAPYRARTKGKDERGGGYVKKNAMLDGSLRAGRLWKPISRSGRAMLPISGCTARLARHRLSAFGVRRLAP
jgi:transposase